MSICQSRKNLEDWRWSATLQWLFYSQPQWWINWIMQYCPVNFPMGHWINPVVRQFGSKKSERFAHLKTRGIFFYSRLSFCVTKSPPTLLWNFSHIAYKHPSWLVHCPLLKQLNGYSWHVKRHWLGFHHPWFKNSLIFFFFWPREKCCFEKEIACLLKICSVNEDLL